MLHGSRHQPALAPTTAPTPACPPHLYMRFSQADSFSARSIRGWKLNTWCSSVLSCDGQGARCAADENQAGAEHMGCRLAWQPQQARKEMTCGCHPDGQGRQSNPAPSTRRHPCMPRSLKRTC